MTIRTALLTASLILLIINIFITIKECIYYYHLYYPCGAHPGRMRGSSVPMRGASGAHENRISRGVLEIDGLKYNVVWYILEGQFVDEKRGDL